jgi:hypothetical protein
LFFKILFLSLKKGKLKNEKVVKRNEKEMKKGM